MSRAARKWCRERKWSLALSLGLAVLSLSLASRVLVSGHIPPLRMSAGPEGTRRHAIVETLVHHAARAGLKVSLSPNAGTEQSLQQIKAGQLDVALISNGVSIPDDESLAVLAVTQMEEVHLLARKEITEAESILDGLRGKRVNLGQPGSTEALLSRELLRFARIRLPEGGQSGEIVPTEFGKTELLAQCQAIRAAEGARKSELIAQLPDVLVLLAAAPSAVAQQLIEAADYRIVALPATRAFLLDNLQESASTKAIVQREFLEQTVIPRHSYFAHRAFPEEDCETVGVRLLLVARQDCPAVAVRTLMATLFEGELAHRLRPLSPREVANPYPLHTAARAYLDRDKPVAIDSVLEWLNNGLSIFGAFSAGALSLYSLLRTRSATDPADYYAAIHKVEHLAQTMPEGAPGEISHSEFIRHLDERLVRLRQELIEDICEGRIKGEATIANILALLKDARRNLQSQAPGPAERIVRYSTRDANAA